MHETPENARFEEVLRAALALNALMRDEIAVIKRRLRARIAANAFSAALERKYNPNWGDQPRAPRGAPNGGQWIDGGASALVAPRPRVRPRQSRERTRLGRPTYEREHMPRLPIRAVAGPVAAATLPLDFYGDTPRPYQTSRPLPGHANILLVETHFPGSSLAHLERVITPEREEPRLIFGQDVGLTRTIPAIRERLNVAVIVENDHAVYDRAELERAIANAAREAPGSGIATETDEERDLVSTMAGRGASNREIQNALEDLRRARGAPTVLELIQRAPHQPPRIAHINLAHIFDGDVRRNIRGGARGAGGHYLRSPNIRVVRIRNPADSHGVIKAYIEVRDHRTGRWIPKPTASSFFPETWSRRRVQMEIEGAWANSYPIEGNRWRGRSPSGLRIEGAYARPEGDAASAWPVHEADQ